LNDRKYWEEIRKLRNDERVKPGFIQQSEISFDDHVHYMEKNSQYFYVCLDNEQFAGYIGNINNDIRVATHPNYQNKGVATFMLNELMKRHPEATAKVKIENEASLRLFEKCGFKKKYFLLEKE
jgi:RimJ/RimL family protein N-acetyltransferase